MLYTLRNSDDLYLSCIIVCYTLIMPGYFIYSTKIYWACTMCHAFFWGLQPAYMKLTCPRAETDRAIDKLLGDRWGGGKERRNRGVRVPDPILNKLVRSGDWKGDIWIKHTDGCQGVLHTEGQTYANTPGTLRGHKQARADEAQCAEKRGEGQMRAGRWWHKAGADRVQPCSHCDDWFHSESRGNLLGNLLWFTFLFL